MILVCKASDICRAMGKFPSSGCLRLTLKQVEWFVLWWREVFLSTYFSRQISVDLRREVGSSFVTFRDIQETTLELFMVNLRVVVQFAFKLGYLHW